MTDEDLRAWEEDIRALYPVILVPHEIAEKQLSDQFIARLPTILAQYCLLYRRVLKEALTMIELHLAAIENGHPNDENLH
jgi:hypothetical protein